MPDHNTHYNIEEIFIGQKMPDVDSLLDIFSKEGPNHRRRFHEDKIVMDVLRSTKSIEAAWAARYHLIADRMVREEEPPVDTPENVRSEAIVAEIMDLMARGEVEMVVFPKSVIMQLISSILNGNTKLVDPLTMPALKQKYLIRRKSTTHD